MQRKFDSSLWFDVNAYDHPKLAEYIYGLILYPHYLKSKKIFNQKEYSYTHFLIDHNFYKIYSYQYEQYKNKINFIEWGKKPWEVMDVSPDYLIKKFGQGIKKTVYLIFIARKVNVYILTLNVLVVYFLSFVLSNSMLIAFLTSLFFGTNTLIVTASLRAQSDGLFLFLFNLCLLFLVLFFKNKKHSFKIGLLFFFFAALLNATKINGIMLVFIFYFIAFLMLVERWVFKNIIEFQILETLIFGSFLFLLVFICHHPLLIRQPIKGTVLLYKHRQETALHQARYELPETALWSFKERMMAIYNNFFSGNGVKIFNNYYPLHRLINKYPYFFSKFFLISFISGFFLFIKEKRKEHWYFIISFILTITFMGFYLLLDWDRYYIELNFYVIFLTIFIWKIIKNIF